MSSLSDAHPVTDPELPAVSLLLSRSALEVLASAMEQEGAVVHGMTATKVSYRPGRRIVVSYEARVAWGSEIAQETLVAMARNRALPDGAITVDAADGQVAVWRVPKDPYLPGLERAMNPTFVRALLDEIGAPPGRIQLELRAYWPRRHAVVEVKTTPPARTERLVFRPDQGFMRPGPDSVMYLKVVRPDQAAKLNSIHDKLAGKAPVADCHYHSDELGLLVLAALPGETLWDCVKQGHQPPPEGQALYRLLEGLGQIEIDRSVRLTSREGARAAVLLLSTILPMEAARIEHVAHALGEDRDPPPVTIHGDFHEVQVLAEGGEITGLLDVDDAGPGQRADDMAMMAGRFWSFAPFERRGGERVAQYALDLLETFAQFTDPEDLDQRVAAILLARATSPFRAQSYNWPRDTRRAIELAERWLTPSGRVLAAALSV